MRCPNRAPSSSDSCPPRSRVSAAGTGPTGHGIGRDRPGHANPRTEDHTEAVTAVATERLQPGSRACLLSPLPAAGESTALTRGIGAFSEDTE